MGVGGLLIKFSLFAIVTAAFVHVLLHNDYFKKVYNHQPGPCRLVKNVVDGSEDIELLPNGIAVVSSGLRYMKSVEMDNVVGKLFLFDFNANPTQPKADEIKLLWNAAAIKTFNPHGIKSHINNKGEITLYVISHPPEGDKIEMFTLDVEKKEAKYVKSLKHELFKAINNFVMLGPEEFYVSNDHYFHNSFMVTMEYFLPYIRLGSLVYYNKGKAMLVDQFLHTPNGLAVDKKHKFLFKASPLDRALVVYTINKDMTITKRNTIQLDTAIDNLFLDEASLEIWTGSHPVLHKLISHMPLPKSVSTPSHVIRFQFKDANYNEVTIHDPYMNDGSVLSASSVAIKYKNQILIGTVHQKLLLCDLIKE